MVEMCAKILENACSVTRNVVDFDEEKIENSKTNEAIKERNAEGMPTGCQRNLFH